MQRILIAIFSRQLVKALAKIRSASGKPGFILLLQNIQHLDVYLICMPVTTINSVKGKALSQGRVDNALIGLIIGGPFCSLSIFVARERRISKEEIIVQECRNAKSRGGSVKDISYVIHANYLVHGRGQNNRQLPASCLGSDGPFKPTSYWLMGHCLTDSHNLNQLCKEIQSSTSLTVSAERLWDNESTTTETLLCPEIVMP